MSATEAVNQAKLLNSSGWTAYICIDSSSNLVVRRKNASFYGLSILEVCKAVRCE